MYPVAFTVRDLCVCHASLALYPCPFQTRHLFFLFSLAHPWNDLSAAWDDIGVTRDDVGVTWAQVRPFFFISYTHSYP